MMRVHPGSAVVQTRGAVGRVVPPRRWAAEAAWPQGKDEDDAPGRAEVGGDVHLP